MRSLLQNKTHASQYRGYLGSTLCYGTVLIEYEFIQTSYPRMKY